MIEILILYVLYNKVLTMYGISKDIKINFFVLTTPSYGTIKPALDRLRKADCIKSQKTMSKGGRPSVYYSITSAGKEKFKELVLEKPAENPIQFLPVSRIKVACCEILDNNEKSVLYKQLKQKAELIFTDCENIVKSKDKNFYLNIVIDNLMCEYKNFISLIDGLLRS